MSSLRTVHIVKSLLMMLCLGKIDTRRETLEPHLTRGETAKHYMEGVVRGCRTGKKRTVDVYHASENGQTFGAGRKRRPGK